MFKFLFSLLLVSLSFIVSVNPAEATSSMLAVEKASNDNLFIKINYEDEYSKSRFIVRGANGCSVVVSDGEIDNHSNNKTQVSVTPIQLKDTDDLLLNIIAKKNNNIIFDGYFKTVINNTVTIKNSNMTFVITPLNFFEQK